MGVNLRTIKDIKDCLAGELKELYTQKEISTLAGIIIKTVFKGIRLHQLHDPEFIVAPEKASEVKFICEELRSGKPYQYVLGETTFYGCTIRVNEHVLIPRPETEELVDLVIRENKGYTGSIFDFGTGSGCIAVALASNLPGSSVTGIDISPPALDIAKENAKLNNVRITFMEGDIFSFSHEASAGIIVANPPYVRESEKLKIQRNVLDFEPHAALFVSDSDPLAYYRALLEISLGLLDTGGKLYFEINEAMGGPLLQLFRSFGYSDATVARDLNDRERIIKAVKNG